MDGKRLPDRCRRCRHSEALWSWDGRRPYIACLYILHRAERRPCPAGAGCVMYERKGARKREQV